MAKMITRPKMYGAVIMVFNSVITLDQVEKVLGECVDYQVYEGFAEVTYREIRDYRSWEINDLLTELFKLCDLEKLALTQNSMNAKVHLDLSFHQYGKYPALLFAGENMKIIHAIQADISIDPY